jgi:hypothetical protein
MARRAVTRYVGISAVNADIISQDRRDAPDPRYLREHLQNLACDQTDISLDLLQRPRGNVSIEVAIEVDLIADRPDEPVLVIALVRRSRHPAGAA